MKVDKLVSANQQADWFNRITHECAREYPVGLVLIGEDELVIDAGCNVGGFRAAFGDRFKNQLPVDASSYNCEEYEKHHGIKPIHKALYSTDGEIVKLRKFMAWETDDTNSGNFGITGIVDENNNGYKSEEYEEVETLSLDTLIKDFDEVGLLKIDIEAAEFDFLYKKDLSKIKYITGEFHNLLFKFDDRGVTLLEWIKETHDEIYSDGNGNDSHYVKLYRRKGL